MHETGLARQLLSAVLARAAAVGATRVRVATGWIAETEMLSAESLAFHFAAHARGTLAEGARLDLRLVHVQARCRACGRTYAPEHHVLLCTGCGSTDGELLGRTGLGLEELEVEP
jgi:hydrogenase nickel incorporation protein HypA/HybF